MGEAKQVRKNSFILGFAELIFWLIGPVLFFSLYIFPLLSPYIRYGIKFDYIELIYNNIGSIILFLCIAIFPLIFRVIFSMLPLQYIKFKIDNKVTNVKEPKEIPIKEPQTYFDSLVNINIDHLNGYYRMVKEHTNKSFINSLSMSITGFILIIVGSALIYMNKIDQNISFIVTFSGILIEFISGCAFYLYNKTVRQLKDYFDSLVHVQKILLSFKVVEDTKDDISESKNIMMHKALEYIWQDRNVKKEESK